MATAGSATGTSSTDAIFGNLQQLKEDYRKQLRKDFDYTGEKIADARNEGLRDSYLSHQRDMAGLPEELAAMGVTGGGAESNLVKMKADYQNERNDLHKNSNEQLSDAAQQMQQSAAEGDRGYNESWLQYLMDLKRDEDQFERDKELARIR